MTRVRAALRRRRSMSAAPEDARGDAGEVIWQDQWGCFRVHSDSADAPLRVTEMLHEAWGEVPLQWNSEFDDLEAAQRWIAYRLRLGHDRWYHRADMRAGVAG